MCDVQLYGIFMVVNMLTIRLCRLFWFAWSARQDVHWIVPVIAGIPFAWGNLLVFVSAALYLIDVYGPMNGASAMAANGLARYGLGAGE